MTEIWTSIPSIPGYEVSNLGRVRRSEDKFIFTTSKRGTVNINQKTIKVCRKMAEAFLNDGNPLRRNQVVSGGPNLASIKINPACYHVKRRDSKKLVAQCLRERVNPSDQAISDYVFEKSGVRLARRTAQRYRLDAGYKRKAEQ